jgi:hypothetical protein
LKTSDVVEALAIGQTYSVIGMCQVVRAGGSHWSPMATLRGISDPLRG